MVGTRMRMRKERAKIKFGDEGEAACMTEGMRKGESRVERASTPDYHYTQETP